VDPQVARRQGSRQRTPRSTPHFDRLVTLCPPCHAQTDATYARGRLVITPLGGGRFSSTVIRGPDKRTIGA